jgi:nucleoside-diphosphate-sugar epimerase
MADKNETLLLTGASGFLGKVLFNHHKGFYDISTIARSNGDFKQDIRRPFILKSSFDIVVHCAGKAHLVPKTEEEKNDFFLINYQGTVNIVESLPKAPKSLVFISTVAVYGKEEGQNINEDADLEGTEPYALSKIKAEFFLENWARENNVKLTILRLPLIAGPNPPGNLGAMIKAVRKGYYFRIGGGSARRSLIWAEDIATFISHIADKGGVYNLTDNMHPSFREIDTAISSVFNKRVKLIPEGMIKVAAKVGDFIPRFPINTYRFSKMTNTLTFSNEKAKATGWQPRNTLDMLAQHLKK